MTRTGAHEGPGGLPRPRGDGSGPDGGSDRAAGLRVALVSRLWGSGPLRDPRWREAFEAVPREVFLPAFFRPVADAAGWRVVRRGDPDYLELVYTDDALVTQLDGRRNAADAVPGGPAGERLPVPGRPSSSSSQPGLMALMLQALAIRPGQRVLEVGSGTGYNCALLSHRIGERAVFSVDVDAGIVDKAAEALASCGYAPTLAVGDGSLGLPGHAPYDRVITTCGFPAVPAGWLAQTRPGGLILVPLDRAVPAGVMVLLRVDGPDRAVGRVVPDFGGFMPRRDPPAEWPPGTPGTPSRSGADPDVPWPPGPGRALRDRRETLVPKADLATSDNSLFAYLALSLPVAGVRRAQLGEGQLWWHDDGSWLMLPAGVASRGMQVIEQGGPRPLWDEVELAYGRWLALGRPSRERLGMTVTPGGHEVWLDDPAGPHRWALPD